MQRCWNAPPPRFRPFTSFQTSEPQRIATPGKSLLLCGRTRPQGALLGKNGGARATRTPERGPRHNGEHGPCAAARMTTGPRTTRGRPWSSNIETIVCGICVAFKGSTKANGNRARTPRVARSWETVVWVKREPRNTLIQSFSVVVDHRELAEQAPEQLRERLDAGHENPASPRPRCAAKPAIPARACSRASN